MAGLEQGMAPQGQPGGDDVAKDATAGIMQQLDAIGSFAQTIGEADPEAAKMGMQGVEMIKQMLAKLGAVQGAPQQAANAPADAMTAGREVTPAG